MLLADAFIHCIIAAEQTYYLRSTNYFYVKNVLKINFACGIAKEPID